MGINRLALYAQIGFIVRATDTSTSDMEIGLKRGFKVKQRAQG